MTRTTARITATHWAALPINNMSEIIFMTLQSLILYFLLMKPAASCNTINLFLWQKAKSKGMFQGIIPQLNPPNSERLNCDTYRDHIRCVTFLNSSDFNWWTTQFCVGCPDYAFFPKTWLITPVTGSGVLCLLGHSIAPTPLWCKGLQGH